MVIGAKNSRISPSSPTASTPTTRPPSSFNVRFTAVCSRTSAPFARALFSSMRSKSARSTCQVVELG